jgi:hypothetical protein
MTEHVLPKTTTELLADIDAEWSALMDVIEKLTPEQLVSPGTGGWAPKDNLAHLTEWMNILVGYHMDNRPSHEVTGLPKEVTDNWDYDVVNKIFFERNRQRSAEDVLGEFKQVYSAVIERLQSMPFEDLMKPRYPDDPERQPLLNWVIGNTSGHFAEHRLNIEKGV